jgi:hypothetical protein
MELADFIEAGLRPPQLPFLIIGGLAVGAHGHVRATFDVDLLEMLVKRNRLDLRDPKYRELFLKYGTPEIYETILRLTRGS